MRYYGTILSRHGAPKLSVSTFQEFVRVEDILFGVDDTLAILSPTQARELARHLANAAETLEVRHEHC